MANTRDVACAVEVPGVRSATAALLMRDGTWRNGFDGLRCPERRAVDQWISRYGAAFIARHRDLLDLGGA